MVTNPNLNQGRRRTIFALSNSLHSFQIWSGTFFCTLIIVGSIAAQVTAMDFGWGTDHAKPNEKPDFDNSEAVIWMVGDIYIGDYDKFRKFILADPDKYISSGRSVYLSSNGGNVVESLRLATLLKYMYADVNVEYREKCASSCFFLYVGGVARHASFKDTLGVHRAYFEPSYFAGMSPFEAEKKQVELTKLVADFLDANSVSRSLIEKMTSTSSKEIHWLTSEEIDAIGEYPPWYEEFLIAKCGYQGRTKERELFLKALNSTNIDAWIGEIGRVKECEDKFVAAELKRTLRTVLQEADPLRKSQPPSPTQKSPN